MLRRFFAFLATALLLGVAIAPAHALDKAKAAATMGQQAAKAYEKGDYATAARLYLEAWRADGQQPEYIYAAARAEHVAGWLDRALEHYKMALATKGLPNAVRAKAQGYLQDALATRAATQVQEADKALQSGDAKLAAQLYHDAYDAVPARLDWLFKAAVAEQAGHDDAAARLDFSQYLQSAPAGAEFRKQAEVRLESLSQPAPAQVPEKPVAVTQPNKPKPVVVAQGDKPARVQPIVQPVVKLEASPPSKWSAWAVLAGGAGLLAGGLGVYLAQGSERDRLDAAMQPKDTAGHYTGLAYDEFTRRRESLNTNYAISATLAGTGVVAAGVGTWLLLRQPGKVAIGPDSILLAWQF